MTDETSPERRRRKPSQEIRDSKEVRTAMAALGTRVRQLRQDEKLTLEAAAERTGLDWKHLQKLESAKINVTLTTLVRVAIGYRVSLAELFSAPGRPSPRRSPPRREPGHRARSDR